MAELCTITLPAGTALRGDRISSQLHSSVTVVCEQRDEWLVRAALDQSGLDQSRRFFASQVDPRSSIPAQATGTPVMSATNSSSLASKNCEIQSRICAAELGVSTIQVVVNLHQQAGKA